MGKEQMSITASAEEDWARITEAIQGSAVARVWFQFKTGSKLAAERQPDRRQLDESCRHGDLPSESF